MGLATVAAVASDDRAPGDPAGYAIAFDEARRALDAQEKSLEAIRTRMGTMFSVAAAAGGIAAGVIADRASRVDTVGAIGLIVAGLAFLAVAIALVIVWWPVDVTFNVDAGVLVGDYVEGTPPAAVAEIRRELALHHSNHLQANRNRIDTRLRAFSIASIALATEVLALVITAVDLA